MAITKTLKHAGSATATWLFSGNFTDVTPILEPEDFDQLPPGRLRDVVTANYTSDVDPVDYDASVLNANQKLTKFSAAWGAEGGSVSTALAVPDFVADPNVYAIQTGSFSISPLTTRVQMVVATASGLVGPTGNGHAIVKLSLNYSAGR